MESIREGGSTTPPPMLDGLNYTYWKARMIAFLKSIDNKTWKVVVSRWTPPQVTDTDGKMSLKPKKNLRKIGQKLKMRLP